MPGEITTYQPGWIVTIIDRAPRLGERGFWVGDDDELELALDKLLADHDGCARDDEWGWPVGLREPDQYDDYDGTRCVTVVAERES